MNRRHRAYTAILAGVLLLPVAGAAPVSAAVGPNLVKDIKASGGSQPAELTAIGNTLFFTANGQGGRELWTTDGTSSGTARVKNIRPGWKGSNPNRLTNIGDILYFSANDGTHGYELWRSDGTAAGTWMVDDITPGSGSSSPAHMTDVDGTLFFFRQDPGNQLWTSDGAPGGTQLVKVIDAGGPHNPSAIFAFDGRAWFFYASEQWVSDGTPGGTETYAGDPFVWGPPVKVGSNYFFTATEGSTGVELYVSTDGTLGATEDSVKLVADIRPGPDSSQPRDFVNGGRGRLFFTADDGVHGRQLWKSNGTPEGTRPLTNLEDTAMEELTRFKSGIVFLTLGEIGPLWKSNGTKSGTKNIAIEPRGAGPLEAVGPTLVFHGTVLEGSMTAAVPPHDSELWRTDGTSAGTRLVFDINPTGSSSPRDLVRVGSAVYFTAADGVHGRELWRYVP